MDHTSIMFQKALAIIEASGAQFRIIMPDGTHYGQLAYTQPAPEKPKRGRNLKHPYGALRTYYKPFIDPLEPEGYVEVPYGPFLGTTLASSISAYGCHNWGNGMIVVAQNNEKKVVEVMRAKAPIPSYQGQHREQAAPEKKDGF